MLRRPLRRQCHRLVKALAVPDPWNFEEFCALLERERGRPIRVMPPIPVLRGGPCGLCITTKNTDYIYIVETSRFHREHIALHEIGHLLCGHDADLKTADLADLLAPNLDPAKVAKVLGRTGYSTDQEHQAEYFATLVLAHTARRVGSPRAADPRVAEVLGRLEQSWGRSLRHSRA